MRAIRRAKMHDDVVRQLGEVVGGRAIFGTMREVMCFAAVLGFASERREKLEGDTEEIESRIWQNNQQALDLLYLIPLVSERTADILRDENEDRMITVFEEFANGGLGRLKEWLAERPEDIHGDQAILAALQKHGFLKPAKDADQSLSDVSF